MKKIFSLIYMGLYTCDQVVASPDRIPDDSTPGPISMAIGIILAIGFVVLFGPMVFKDILDGKADKDTKQFGCGIFLLAAVVVLLFIVKCS